MIILMPIVKNTELLGGVGSTPAFIRVVQSVSLSHKGGYPR
jgi:hypothetical protein